MTIINTHVIDLTITGVYYLYFLKILKNEILGVPF